METGEVGLSAGCTTLEQYFGEPDKHLPASVEVQSGYSGWQDNESLKSHNRVLLTGLQENQIVRMTDDTGGDFEESLPFQRCKFMLLQQDKPWLDGKEFKSVAEVMKMPEERRPAYLRTQRGMLFSAEEGLSTDEILRVTSELAVNEDDNDCAVWYRLASADDATRRLPLEERKATKILLPLVDIHSTGTISRSSRIGSSSCLFDTLVDPKKYELQEITGLTQEGVLKFPLRVKAVDVQPSIGSAPAPSTLPDYTIVGVEDAKWLVGLDLADGSFFRVPSSMQSRITVKASEWSSTDLKLCMHAVLESLSDTDLPVIGPQAEGSLSSRCTTIPRAIARRPSNTTPAEGDGNDAAAGAGGVGQVKTSASKSVTFGEPSVLSAQGGKRPMQRRVSMPVMKSASLGSYYSAGTTAGCAVTQATGFRRSQQSTTRLFSTRALQLDHTSANGGGENADTAAAAVVGATKSDSPAARTWSVGEVLEKLEELVLGQYSAQFQREEVTGELLLILDEEMLRDDFAMSNRFHQRKLMAFINKLKS